MINSTRDRRLPNKRSVLQSNERHTEFHGLKGNVSTTIILLRFLYIMLPSEEQQLLYTDYAECQLNVVHL